MTPVPPRTLAPREVLAPEADRVPAFAEIAVRWRVARSALCCLAPGSSSRSQSLTLSVVIVDPLGSPTACVRIEDPAGGATAPIDPARVAAEVIPDIHGIVHIEAPGWLHATLAPARGTAGEDGGWTLLYARSPVLDRLGIPGGRADVLGVRAV